MKPAIAILVAVALSFTPFGVPPAEAYLMDTTIPQAGGCPSFDRWNLSLASPLDRRWSTSLPSSPVTLRTAATSGTPAQLTEIEQADRGFVWRMVRRDRDHVQRHEPSGHARAARAGERREFVHQRCGKQRGWTQHDLLQPVEHGIFKRGAGVHARDHGQCSGSFGWRERPRDVRGPDS